MPQDLLHGDSSETDSTSETDDAELKINHDFAHRFEYNKKREELQKLEEKYGKEPTKRKRDGEDGPAPQSEEDTSSNSEDEDDAGDLATAALDEEIMATLNAIKSKDPRVYDGRTTFYTAFVEDEAQPKEKVDKPIFLRDYHRENLLNGVEEDSEDPRMSYNQEQERLKASIVNEIHAVADDSDEGDLLVAKQRERPVAPTVDLDLENATKDPETFLSNFMVSRAWVPTEHSKWQPLESDDEEDDRRAEAFEEAYNMRFEDPNKSNETLRTHGRDIAARYSVRREEKNSRKRKRELEKELKEIEKQQHKEEKARLRRLRIEEVEDKLRKIKTAAGLKTSDIRLEDWSHFVDEDWNDAKWEEEMQQRFGEKYYAEKDIGSDMDNNDKPHQRRKKPKFEDDIDINDIVPEFNMDEAEFSLTDDETASRKGKRNIQERKKQDAKKERRIIEQLVDDQLQLGLDKNLPGKESGFRYRETSPQTFGLSARDILLADDSQLNQFAGLKKLAAFRDVEKKRKDKKHLGKKARLRQWRKETFGHEDGLQESELIPTQGVSSVAVDGGDDGVDIRTLGKKKRRRSRRQKLAA